MLFRPIVFCRCFLLVSAFLSFTAVAPLWAKNTDALFPVYPSIEPNIAFWKDVYSRYTSNQGIIHDTDNLAIVYEVIDLEPRTSRSARRRNLRHILKTKSRYAELLRKLAHHPNTRDKEALRIKQKFDPGAKASDFLKAASQIRYQKGQKNYFRDGLVRSGRYMDEIRQIFKRHQLPLDLVYLPHVESSFNLNAYSKFGAAGIWQFTYRTGKRYMTVDYTVDQRWDPIYAADAAARLLKRNYQILESWPLALTAYNHGANAMRRAKKAKGNYERIFLEYDGRRFRFASRNFYSSFIAARDIAKNYRSYFPGLELSQPLKTKTFPLKGFIAVKDLASHLKISPRKIRSFNRSLREPVFRDQKYIPKGFLLRLPDDPVLTSRMASLPDELFQSEQKRSRFYYVRKGDVASVIARRHGITLQDLIWANNLDHRARIYAGQNLRIPTPEDSRRLAARFSKPEAAEEKSAAEKRFKKQQGKKELPPESGVQPAKGAAEGREAGLINPAIVTANIRVKRTFQRNGSWYGVIQVDTGETLGHFADWLQVSTQTIRNLNRLAFRQEIHMDQSLVIPFSRVDREQFEERRYEFHKEFEEDFLNAYAIEGTWNYHVQRGDNIWTLCKEQFDLPVWLIKKYNLSLNLNRLQPGQTIVIPIVEEREENQAGGDRP